jgi:hypothetical protein
MQILKGIHSLVWEKSGLCWTTPEAILCEDITSERLERAYKFIRLKRGDDWKPPQNFTAEYLGDSKVLQMRAPQYSRPMASSVFLYVFEKLINKNKII